MSACDCCDKNEPAYEFCLVLNSIDANRQSLDMPPLKICLSCARYISGVVSNMPQYVAINSLLNASLSEAPKPDREAMQ